MSAGRIHLCGGGWNDAESLAHEPFFAEAAAHSSSRSPRIVVLLWAQTHDDGLRWHQPYRDRYAAIGRCEVDIVQLSDGRPLAATDLDGADGIVVGGGPTPGYHQAIVPQAAAIRRRVTEGAPYSGASAGAMIAARQALIGGRSVEGIRIAPEKASDGLDVVTVVPGLGLVDTTIDVHIAQYGTLGRLATLVESSMRDEALGIDEDTVLIVDGELQTVVGSGCVWRARRSTGEMARNSVTITRHQAGNQLPAWPLKIET